MCMEKLKTRTGIIQFVIAAVVGIVIAFIPESELLTREAMIFLGIFIWFVLMCVFDLAPLHVTTLALLLLCVLTKIQTIPQAFGPFGSATVWLVFGVLSFAAALGTSGFLTRLALWILRLFPPSFSGIVTALTAVPVVLGPAIPSTTAKATLIASLAVPMAEEAGYEKNSRQSAGVFTAFFAPILLFSPIFLTGAVLVTSMLALLPSMEFSWLSWLQATWLYGVISLVLCFIFVLFFFGPRGEERKAAKAARAELKARGEKPVNPASAKLTELGPMKKNELIGLVAMIATLALWLTESFHGINTATVAIAVVLIMTFLGVFTPADYQTKIPWTIIIITGAILNLIALFTQFGISTWLGSLLGPVLSFASNPYLMILIMAVISLVLRFFIPSQLTIVVVMLAVFGGIASAVGISPFVIVFATFMASSTWQMPFNSSVFVAVKGITDKMVEHKHLRIGSYGTWVCVTIALLASVPLWQIIGYIA